MYNKVKHRNLKMKINKKMMELNKPSELCQIVCMDKDKNLTGTLNTTQLDIMNMLLYLSRESIIKNNISDIDEFYKIEIPLAQFNAVLNLNNHNVYNHIINSLAELKTQLFIVNALGKNKTLEKTITSFVHKITFTKHKNSKHKFVKLILDGDIISLLIHTKKLFSKMYLQIQFSMNSKYSKLLYEILKDYENIKQITIDLELLLALINVDISKKTNTRWSTFRTNILEKAIKEINDKSDIYVEYTSIKEKPSINDRLQVTKIKFSMSKQSDVRLGELGLLNPPENSIINNVFYNKSKDKLDRLTKVGYVIHTSEDGWIEQDIKKYKTQYESEIRIDTWLKETSIEDRNKIYFELIHHIDDCDDPVVTIEDYKLIGVFSKFVFTRNPSETIKLLNETILSMGEYEY